MRRFGKMMREVLRSAFQKPATVLYPAVKVKMPPKFRGKLAFFPERCICCKLCMRDCPTGAITIRKVAEKQFEADIDLSKCIYCAQCVDSCPTTPKKAMDMDAAFEIADFDRHNLKMAWVFARAVQKPRTPAAPKTETPT